MRGIVAGAISGAAGTVALNASTYIDMAVRARPASSMPEEAVQRVADAVGVDLAGSSARPDETRAKRAAGLGPLLGFAVGIGMGMLYGAIRPRLRRVGLPAASATLGLGAMAASDLPAIATGLTDPREWGTAGLVADLAPHLVYGLVTAAVFESITEWWVT